MNELYRTFKCSVLLVVTWTTLGGAPAGAAGPDGGAVANAEARSVAAGMVLHCEVSCGRTPKRAGVARITWTMPERGLQAAGATSPSLSRPILDASVFKGRFIPDNYVELPVMRSQAGALAAQPTASSRVASSRVASAYDLRVTDYNQATSAERAPDAVPDAEDVVVVEGLAPGMVYTWRLRIPVGDGFVESAMVSCQAPTCPVDFRKEKKP